MIHKIYGLKHDIPIPFYIITKIKQICEGISNVYKYDFIDVGSGNGNLLNKLSKYNLFRKYIG